MAPPSSELRPLRTCRAWPRLSHSPLAALLAAWDGYGIVPKTVNLARARSKELERASGRRSGAERQCYARARLTDMSGEARIARAKKKGNSTW